MPNGSIMNDNIDPKTWRGYVTAKLEDLAHSTQNLTESIHDLRNNQVCKEDFVNLCEQVQEITNTIRKCIDCNNDQTIQDLTNILYGNKEDREKGLITKVSNIALSLKIKSSLWGTLGGGGFAAIMALLYFLMTGKL